MRNVAAIAQRELKAYFASPIAYVVTAAFLVVAGFFFSIIVFLSREATMRGVFYNEGIILMLLAPALTMRLLAEEQQSGTLELLLTAPVRDLEVVLGKFLASLGLFAAMVGLTLFFPLILFIYGSPDRGPLLGGYLGVVLLGGVYLAIGLFTSSLTQNQIVAAVVAFVILLLLWVFDWPAGIFGPPASDVFSFLSLSNHYFDFARGLIDTRDVIYYLSVMALALFLTVQSLQSRRWR
jgi:ABC-2 type transport system permease protein